MKLLNTFFRLRCISLFLYVMCIHSVSAFQSVDFSISPSSGSAAPLFVTISTRNLVVPLPGFVISGYKWQVSGPETKNLAGVAEQVVQLNRTGTYAITLTVTEFGLEEDGPKDVNGKQVIETFQTTRTGCATKTVTVGNPTTPTTNACEETEKRISLGTQEVATPEPVVVEPVVIEPEPQPQENNTDNGSGSSGLDDFFQGTQTPTTDQTPEPEAEIVVSSFPLLGNLGNASFYGGVDNGGLQSNGSSFGSTAVVNIEVDLKVAPEHIGQQGDILVAIEYFAVGSELGQFYFKTESTAFPFIGWDLISAMTPAQSSVTLGDIHNIKVFSGHFQNLAGTYNVYFGYSLQNGAIFVHNYPDIPLTFNVTQ